MKKSYLMIAAAAALFAACSETDTFKNEIVGNETELIGFETYHGKATRAAINAEADLTDDNGGFGVYGFKHKNNRTVTSNGTIDLSDVSQENNENYVTTVFDNVKVWYSSGAATDNFTYAVPKYWDKLKNYTFFAYAPQTVKAQGSTKGIAFDQSKGLFTRNDIIALQSTNNSQSNAGPNSNRVQYGDSIESGADLKDYLIAPYVPTQKAGYTNHSSNKNTVQFTFSHILSKLNVYVRAKNESAAVSGHEYAGVKDIQVTKLNIQNMPISSSETATYEQIKANEVGGKWTPGKYTTTLNIIGGTGALTSDPLYILDGGDGTATSVTAKPQYIPQEFHYFVAPNKPVDDSSTTGVDEGKYILNIDYTITYVDNTTDPFTRSIDLSGLNAAFTEMLQNNIYKIIVTIGLDQIYFDVNTIKGWTPTDNSNDTNVNVD